MFCWLWLRSLLCQLQKRDREAKKAIRLASLYVFPGFFFLFLFSLGRFPQISEMFFELWLSKVQCQKRQAPVRIRKCVVAWLCPAGMLWWGWGVSDCMITACQI